MAFSTIKCCGLMVKALDCHAKGPWFKSHQGHKNSFLLQKLYNFFTFFKNLIFVTKNYRLSNQFWLYKHGVRNALFQTQSHLKYQILIWVTLYITKKGIFSTFHCHVKKKFFSNAICSQTIDMHIENKAFFITQTMQVTHFQTIKSIWTITTSWEQTFSVIFCAFTYYLD